MCASTVVCLPSPEVSDGQPDKERWKELGEQAETEQGPNKLLELVREIDRLLAAKQDRLSRRDQSAPIQHDTAQENR